MSAEPQAIPEATQDDGDPHVVIIEKMDDVTVGMRVEAKDSYGKWFCAKVMEKDEESQGVVVHFDGWSSRYDELLHIRGGRLRHLTQEQLKKKTRIRKPKVLEVGDRVQAKWTDGRMYYGRVLQLLNQMAVVLFDDGVEYTTPITAVRKRHVEPSPSGGESSHTSTPLVERKRRLIERKGGREESTSQPSASPPSSPLFAPKRIYSKSNRFWETDESSCTESDMDDVERFASKRQRRDSSPSFVGSDSDLQTPQKKRGRSLSDLREPYKLRRQLTSRQQYAPPVRKNQRRKLKGATDSNCGDMKMMSVSDESVKTEGGEGEQREAGEEDESEIIHRKSSASEKDASKMIPNAIDEECVLAVKQEGKTQHELTSSTSTDHNPRNKTTVETESSPKKLSEAPCLPSSSSSTVHSSIPPPSPSSPLQPPHSPPSSLHTSHHPPPSSSEPISNSPQNDPSPSVSKSPSKQQQQQQQQNVTRRRNSSSNSQTNSVNTRFRAQTAFENSKKGKVKGREPRKQVAPKELVIVWDHNEYKCQHSGCTKSFRKQSLLESHMKHYHSIGGPSLRRGKLSNIAKLQSDKTTSKSPVKPPQSSSTNTSPLTPSSNKSPKTSSPTTSISSVDTQSHSLDVTPSPTHPPSAKKLKIHSQVPVCGSITSSLCHKHKDENNSSTTKSDISTHTGNNNKSPKKGSRQKSNNSKSSSATISGSTMASVSMGTPTLPSGSSTGQHKGSTNTSQQPHTHSSSSSSSSSSKHKQSSSSKKQQQQKDRSTREPGSRKNIDSSSKYRVSPSLPTVTAACLPVQRTSQGGGTTQDTTRGQELSCDDQTGGDVVRSDSGDEGDVKAVVVPGTSVGRGGGNDNTAQGLKDPRQTSRSVSPNSEANDDVVHCLCGDETDEGFMIQCEQCLCWQHGDCIGVAKTSLPEKYFCCFCTNPPGLRQNKKYQYDLQWYCDGTLPSLPGGPNFPCPKEMLKCHTLVDRLYMLKKMSHSSKVKLQAARTPNHAYLRQWSKECASLDNETLKNYLAVALKPVVTPGSIESNTEVEKCGNVAAKCSDDTSNLTSATVVESKEEPGEDVSVKIEVAPQLDEVTSLTNGGNSISTASTGPTGLVDEPVQSIGSVKMSVLTHTKQCSKSETTSVRSPQNETSSTVQAAVDASAVSVVEANNQIDHALRRIDTIDESTKVEPDFTPEFGVQELSVFAVKNAEEITLENSQNPTSKPPSTDVSSSLKSTSVPLVPVIPKKGPLQSGSQSAFKPVSLTTSKQQSVVTNPPSDTTTPTYHCPKTPTCTSSQLTSLLTSPISTHPQSLITAIQPSTTLSTCHPQPQTNHPVSNSSVSQTSASTDTKLQSTTTPSNSEIKPRMTQLSRLKLVPNVDTDSIFTETASNLPPIQLSPPTIPVLLKDFTEAFVHGDTTNWFKRMLLLDHIENVQDTILSWIDQIEKDIDELSENDDDDGEDKKSDYSDPAALICGIQATLDQLTTFQQQQQQQISGKIH